MHEIQFPPVLLYDTEISGKRLLRDLPYRNIGHLIFDNPSAFTALKLCGADEGLIKNGSDYERFSSLCQVFPSLASHKVRRGIETLLYSLCGEDITLSPYFAEELWTTLNEIIEEKAVTPLSLLRSLNVESVCLRTPPFEPLYDIDGAPDIYSVIDLSSPLSLISSEKNPFSSLEEFISGLKKQIAEDSDNKISSLRISLDKGYRYVRCGRKHELYDIYTSVISNNAVNGEEKNALITYLFVECARICHENGVNIIANITADCTEAEKLLSYLALNGIVPQSLLLIGDDVRGICSLSEKFTYRNIFGMPSVVPVSNGLEALAEHFPIGMTLEYQEEACDIITAAALINKRQRLKDRLAAISDDFEELYEDIIYGNVKNRMRI